MLEEPDSALAHAPTAGEEALLLPDFWLNEATNVLWLQVRRFWLTQDEGREGLGLLAALVPPTPTAGMGLHAAALEMGIAVGHSTYDTLYLAFALAMGAR